MKDLLRRLEEANPAMRNFKSSYWWFDDLSFIRDHHRPFVIVGDGRMELSPKRAGMLSKKGYIDIVQHRMGRRASLTREGKKKLSQAQDIYDGLVESLEEARYASKSKSASQAPEADAEYVDSILKRALAGAKDQAEQLKGQMEDIKFILKQFRRYRKVSDVSFYTLQQFDLLSEKEAEKGFEIQNRYDFELDLD